MTNNIPDTELLHELAPKAEELFNRHIKSSKVWLPNEFVPYSLGEDYSKGYEWSPQESKLPVPLQNAIYLNLLTEDNLPFYVRDIDGFTGKEDIWGEWTGRWTAEEGRHGIALRELVHTTRMIDPAKLENARMVQVSNAKVPTIDNTMEGFIYVTLQELATRISHKNTGIKILECANNLGDPRFTKIANASKSVLDRIATDENFHFLFYRDLTAAAIEIDPSKFVISALKVIKEFAMPGTGIPGYEQCAKDIASNGIYNARIHHKSILIPVLNKQWKIQDLKNLTPDAQIAQETLIKKIDVQIPNLLAKGRII